MTKPILGHTVFALAALIIPIAALAHGENQAGPHKGFIRMPGTFHTEVVKSKSTLEIYLLDINFENAVSQNSEVIAEIVAEGSTQVLVCAAKDISFLCNVPKNISLKSGQLIVKAKRDGVAGAPAVYQLPLHR